RYAVRITSEIMESNGSSSMASVCGRMLALMDAGVPVKTPGAGISVGLVTEFGEGGDLKRYELLTDIIGSEDHFGDMDYKVCGTETGITGFQLDLKLPGVSQKIMAEATMPTKKARTKLLGIMARAKEIIGGMSREIEVGQTYHGRVVSIKDFGAFVEVFPGKDGLVHISELADFRVNRVEDVAKMGEMIWVKCIGIDDKGRVKLSRKAALKERAAAEAGQTTEPDRVEHPSR